MAKAMIDYAVDHDGDLNIEGGDLVRAESTKQHMADLTYLNKGELKQYPTTGAEANKFKDDEEGRAKLIRTMVQAFMQDGMENVRVYQRPDGIIKGEGNYK